MSIEVKNITKMYGAQKALNDISFSINKGEIVGFLGPNGAGKSTMMRILTTYLKPDSGTASVNQYDITTAADKVQACTGYLPENNPLYTDMYVREYLNFVAQLYHVKNTADRINSVITQTGLSSHSSKKIRQLSKGYKQRVGLASALLPQPDVLLLDEPTTGLDPNQLVEIRELIKKVGTNTTVLLSTHIMQEVEAMCDRVIVINKGTIVADDYLDNLKNNTTQIIHLELDQKVSVDVFKEITYLKEAKLVKDHHYELVFNTDQDMRSVVFDHARDHDLKILSLTHKNISLENMFHDLTSA